MNIEEQTIIDGIRAFDDMALMYARESYDFASAMMRERLTILGDAADRYDKEARGKK